MNELQRLHSLLLARNCLESTEVLYCLVFPRLTFKFGQTQLQFESQLLQQRTMSKGIWQKFLTPEQNLQPEEPSDRNMNSPNYNFGNKTSSNKKKASILQQNKGGDQNKCPNHLTNQKCKHVLKNKAVSRQLSRHANKQKSCVDLQTNRKIIESNCFQLKNGSSHKKGSIVLSHKKGEKSCEISSKKKKSEQFFLPSSFKDSISRNWLGNSKYSHKRDPDNQQQNQDSFSQIFIQQINKTQQNRKLKDSTSGDKCFYQMFITLKQIRDIQKQNLVNNKKVLKILEQKQDVKQKSDVKKESTKDQKKSFKREKSTVKKLAKNQFFEEKVNRVNEKLRQIQKFKYDLQIFVKNAQRTSLSKTKKKSQSAFR